MMNTISSNNASSVAPMPDTHEDDAAAAAELLEWKKEFDHKKIGPISPKKNMKKAILRSSVIKSKSSNRIEYVVGDEVDVDDPFAGPVTEVLTPTPISLSTALATPSTPESRHERSASAQPTSIFDFHHLDDRLTFLAEQTDEEQSESLSPTSVATKSLATNKTKNFKHKKSASISGVFHPTKGYKKIEEEDKQNEGEEASTTTAQAEENMGLKLAAPGAIDVMTGKASIPLSAAPAPHTAPHASRTRASTFDFNQMKQQAPTRDDFFLGSTSNTTDEKATTTMTSNTTTISNAFTADLAKSFVIRSSEFDPYQHQVTVPSASQLLMHAKLCSVMEHFAKLSSSGSSNNSNSINNNNTFDFHKAFVGKNHRELETLYEQVKQQEEAKEQTKEEDDKASAKKEKKDKKLKKKTSSISRIANTTTTPNEPNPDILESLLDTCHDIVVEGRIVSSYTNTEATIFSSQKERQFVVVFRGSLEQQEKPMKTDIKKQGRLVALDNEDHKEIMVHEGFRQSYMNIESKLFTLLNTLSERDPFCDVVFCGHSYGGSLACLGSVRLAALQPSMTVSCHSYGSPKVGDKSFRLLANSLPNLKVMRVEYGSDPYVKLPEQSIGSASSSSSTTNASTDYTWTHVGHTILITPEETPLGGETVSSSSKTTSMNTTTKKTTGKNTPALKVLAYKFEDRKPIKGKKTIVVVAPSQKKIKKSKKDHELCSYVTSLEPFSNGERPWIQHFVGQEGKGIISGLDKEERLVC